MPATDTTATDATGNDTIAAAAEPTAAERANHMGLNLFALDLNLRAQGHSLVGLLAVTARNVYGIDVLPSAEDLAALDPTAEAAQAE